MGIRRHCRVRRLSGVNGVILFAALLLSTSLGCAPFLFAQSVPKTRKVVNRVTPSYPDILKSGHYEGQVRLAVTVRPDGRVSTVEVVGGNPMFSHYASEAVMRWKYAPAPTQTVEEVTFNFNLNSH
jgi:TonB family protein